MVDNLINIRETKVAGRVMAFKDVFTLSSEPVKTSYLIEQKGLFWYSQEYIRWGGTYSYVIQMRFNLITQVLKNGKPILTEVRKRELWQGNESQRKWSC